MRQTALDAEAVGSHPYQLIATISASAQARHPQVEVKCLATHAILVLFHL